MPSKSIAQQKLFGQALSVKRGDKTLSEITDDIEAREKIQNIVDSMTEKEIEDYAKTSHDGLPDKVEEEGEGGNAPSPSTPTSLDSVVGQSKDYFYYGGDTKKRKLTKKEKEILKRMKSKGVLPTFEEFTELSK